MRLILVGGQSRNVGKTSAVCQILAAFPALPWTAVKITQFGHGICSRSGRPCACACDGAWRISAERDSKRGKDTARFLAAGAERVLWVRCRQGELRAVLPELARELRGAEFVICESNSLARYWKPDFYLLLLDHAVADFKPSARDLLPRADALLAAPPRLPGAAPLTPVPNAVMRRLARRLRLPAPPDTPSLRHHI